MVDRLSINRAFTWVASEQRMCIDGEIMDKYYQILNIIKILIRRIRPTPPANLGVTLKKYDALYFYVTI
jgi:hypothetical protein